jgi:hypothetical protein
MNAPADHTHIQHAAIAGAVLLPVHLFATLRALRDKADPMPTDRARAVSEVAKTMIDTARVELEAAALSKAMPTSGFIAIGQAGKPAAAATPPAAPAPAIKPMPGTPPVPNGIKSITKPYLRDDDDEATTGSKK